MRTKSFLFVSTALALAWSLPAFAEPTCLITAEETWPEGTKLTLSAEDSSTTEEDPFTECIWNFGDNSSTSINSYQTGKTKTHSYPAVDLTNRTESDPQFDTYTVTLQLTTQSGQTCEAQKTVHITDASPIVNLILPSITVKNEAGEDVVLPDTALEGQLAEFDGSYSNVGATTDPITKYVWEFARGTNIADATNDDDQNSIVSYAYEDDGNYEVCLTVYDTDSSSTACKPLVVRDLSPIPAFTFTPSIAFEGDVISFNASASQPGGPADLIPATGGYEWDFGDQSATEYTDTPYVSHSYSNYGPYTVTLIVHDEDSTAQITHDININDVSPVAALSLTGTNVYGHGQEMQPLTLDASASRPGADCDPIVKYSWDFGDGTTAETVTPTTEHEWPDNGDYNVSVTVYDQDGSRSTKTERVTIDNIAPVISISAPGIEGNRLTAEQNIPFTLKLNVIDAPGDSHPSTVWNMGDGTTYSDQLEVTHQYTQQGSFNVVVTANDRDGGEAQTTLTVQVAKGLPRFEAIGDQNATEGQPYHLEITVYPSGSDGPLAIEKQILPNGMTVDMQNNATSSTILLDWMPTYADAGNHTVQLAAVAPSGLMRTISFTIKVAEAGNAYIATSGGSNHRGIASVYRIERKGSRLMLKLEQTLELGIGFGDLLEQNGRIFAAVPGSGGVAVIILTPENKWENERWIPTGAGAYALASTKTRLYVANALDHSLSIIDLATLKTITTIACAGEPIALSIADGDLILALRDGTLLRLNSNRLESGLQNAVKAELSLEAPIARVISEDHNLYVSHARQVTEIDLNLWTESGSPIVAHHPLDQEARDLAFSNNQLSIANGANLLHFNGDRVTSEESSAIRLSTISSRLFPGGGLILSDGNHLAVQSSEIQTSLDAAAIRRMTSFVLDDEGSPVL